MNPPLKAILVGCPQGHAQHVTRVLEACSLNVATRFPDVRSAIDGTRLTQSEKVLGIVCITMEEEIQQFKWLRESFVGRPLLVLVDRRQQQQCSK